MLHWIDSCLAGIGHEVLCMVALILLISCTPVPQSVCLPEFLVCQACLLRTSKTMTAW